MTAAKWEIKKLFMNSAMTFSDNLQGKPEAFWKWRLAVNMYNLNF